MKSVPDPERWAAGLAGSHEPALRLTLLSDGTQFTAGISGKVDLDGTVPTRARLDLTLADDGTGDLIPKSAADSLSPYTNELKVERGVAYPDGGTDYASLGIFRIDESEIDDSGAGLQVQIVGLDRSAKIIEAKFEDPYSVPVGTLFTDAILANLQAAYPDVETDFAASSLETPLLVAQEQDDRWDFDRGLAGALGMELFFDEDGKARLRPISTSTVPVYTLAEGEGGVLITAARQWTRSPNRWIVTGSDPVSSTVYRAVATDENPDSPTYYYGKYGHVPTWVDYGSLVASQDQAQDAANGLKAKGTGTAQTINFGSIVNPALEPSDPVQITRERAGIDEVHFIDTLSIPLDSESPMTGTTRMVISNA